MQFHSVGAVKNNVLMNCVLSTLYLFDDTADKDFIKQSRVNLLKSLHKTKGMTWGLTGDSLKTTALAGVKNNKYYLAHTREMLGHTTNGSKDAFFTTGAAPSLDVQAMRYTVVSQSSAKSAGTLQDGASSFIGFQTTTTYSLTKLPDGTKLYFMPESVLPSFRLAAGAVRVAPRMTGNVTGTLSYSESSTWLNTNYEYNIQWTSNLLDTERNTFLNPSTLTTTDATTVYGDGKAIDAVKSSSMSQLGLMFLSTQQETQSWPLGGGYTSFRWTFNQASYSGRFYGMTTDEPAYVTLKDVTPDEQVTLSFGAISYENPLTKKLIILSIGDTADFDMKQTGKNVAEISNLTLSPEILGLVATPTKISV